MFWLVAVQYLFEQLFSPLPVSLLLMFLPDIWREIARSNVMDHAHLCGALHLRGGQWLPLHVVAVSLSSPFPPCGPTFVLILAFLLALVPVLILVLIPVVVCGDQGWQVKNEKLNRNKIHWRCKFPSLTEGEPDGKFCRLC